MRPRAQAPARAAAKAHEVAVRLLPPALAAASEGLARALARAGTAVLSAPPGLGKTTLLPLCLLDAPWLAGRRIVMLEPRRLAARAAARRMAALLGERVGETVGYRVRFDAQVGPDTRIEVVTEGILTRRLHGDAELAGVGLLVFDELHERHLASDLALALALDVRGALRPDLRLLAMSATLDCAAVAAVLGDAPVLRAEGAAHAVEVAYVGGDAGAEAVCAAVHRALAEQAHDVLVFLPGVAEIGRVARRLQAQECKAEVLALHGALERDAQDRVLAAGAHRRVILATNIAETSLTIEGVGAVVDSGLARVPRFDPNSGLTRLVTEPVSQGSATQRSGRAGRLAPGRCYRLWSAAEQARRPAHTGAEILQCDLASLALDLSAWGVADPAQLRWLDAPPAGAFAQARELLARLGALDQRGLITSRGRDMAHLGVHPRLGAMLLQARAQGAASLGCGLAALLEEGSPWVGPARERPVDVETSLMALQAPGTAAATAPSPGRLARIRRTAAALERRLRPLGGPAPRAATPGPGGRAAGRTPGAGELLACAYPDRVAQRRGAHGRFLLASGRALQLPAGEPLAGCDWLVAADLDAGEREGRVYLAAALDGDALPAVLTDRLREVDVVGWDADAGAVQARRETRLDALLVSSTPLAAPEPGAVHAAMLQGVQRMGLDALPWTPLLRQWQARVECLRAWCPGEGLPAVSEVALLEGLERWLGPFLAGCTRRSHLARVDLAGALHALLTRAQAARLEAGAPVAVDLPAGGTARLHYTPGAEPLLAVPLQAMLGMREGPCVAWGRVPVTLQLLSPAGRALQRTRDLASFWRDAYPEVRKQMRGRYPKHHWPEDPAASAPMRGSLKRRPPGGEGQRES